VLWRNPGKPSRFDRRYFPAKAGFRNKENSKEYRRREAEIVYGSGSPTSITSQKAYANQLIPYSDYSGSNI
jgi:hypothetical protein